MLDNELVQLFYKKLHMNELQKEDQIYLLKTVTTYLQHNRSEDIKGRTADFLDAKLSTFVSIGEAIGLSYPEMAQAIGGFPNILNTVDDFYTKYLILGVVENEDNTVRKMKLVTKPRDYAVGLQQVYARYKLVCESGYNGFTWNTLVHASKGEFASIFVNGVYHKPYQLFSNKEEVFKWLDSVDVTEIDVSSFKEMDVNKEIVLNYENKDKGFK